jgi:hypothetical protein
MMLFRLLKAAPMSFKADAFLNHSVSHVQFFPHLGLWAAALCASFHCVFYIYFHRTTQSVTLCVVAAVH